MMTSSQSSVCLDPPTASTFNQQPDLPVLRGVFLADFDPHIGRVIVHQVPSDLITVTRFDSFSSFVIPKRPLLNQLVKINFPDIKVMGYPVCLEHGKYARNAYFFNLCFVVDNVSHDDCVYEPLVRKMAQYLISLESEIELLSNRKSHEDELRQLIDGIYKGLNENGECCLAITSETSVHLKLCSLTSAKRDESIDDSVVVHPFSVPLFARQPPITALPAEMAKLDLITQKVCPHIDGKRTAAEIAAQVLIDVDLVARCCHNLLQQHIISILPVVRYSDIYVGTDALRQCYTETRLQSLCQSYVALRSLDEKAPLPDVNDIFRLYCSLQHGCTLGTWCLRYAPREHGVHERRLIEFGLLRGWLRRVIRYPVFVGRDNLVSSARLNVDFELACDGSNSLDAVAYKFNKQSGPLLAKLSADEKYAIIYK